MSAPEAGKRSIARRHHRPVQNYMQNLIVPPAATALQCHIHPAHLSTAVGVAPENYHHFIIIVTHINEINFITRTRNGKGKIHTHTL